MAHFRHAGLIFNTASVRIECIFCQSNRPFGKLVGKGLHTLESIFSDRPTLDEPFGINFSFVAYITTYLYRMKLTHFPVFLCSKADRYTFFPIAFQQNLMIFFGFFKIPNRGLMNSMFIASILIV